MKKMILAIALAVFCVGCANDNYNRGGVGSGSRTDTGYETTGDLDRTQDPVVDENFPPRRDRSFPGRTGPGEMNPHIPY